MQDNPLDNPLDNELIQVETRIDALAQSLFRDVLKNIKEGFSPQDSIKKAFHEFPVAITAAIESALATVLQVSVGSTVIKNYKVGEVKLSEMVYAQAKEVSILTKRIITEHMQGFIDIKKLSMRLYEGFYEQGYGVGDILDPIDPLPKYLKNLVGQDVYKLADMTLARMSTLKLSTPELRAAYTSYLNGLENGLGKAGLEQKLKVALYEKSRYYATRLSKNEVVKVYNIKLAKGIESNWVQLVPSSRHLPDQCDVQLYTDRYGLGAGVYPKNDCPVVPLHVGCRCYLRERTDIDQDTKYSLDPNADKKYLESLPEDQRKLIFGTEYRQQQVREGVDYLDLLNSQTKEPFRVKTIGELLSDSGN